MSAALGRLPAVGVRASAASSCQRPASGPPRPASGFLACRQPCRSSLQRVQAAEEELSGSGPDEPLGASSQVAQTMANLDAMLGLDAAVSSSEAPEAAAAAAAEALSAAALSAAEAEVPKSVSVASSPGALQCRPAAVQGPPCSCGRPCSRLSAPKLQWAHLSAEEVSRRQALARRHRDLAARQTALAAELADQERRAAHFHERSVEPSARAGVGTDPSACRGPHPLPPSLPPRSRPQVHRAAAREA